MPIVINYFNLNNRTPYLNTPKNLSSPKIKYVYFCKIFISRVRKYKLYLTNIFLIICLYANKIRIAFNLANKLYHCESPLARITIPIYISYLSTSYFRDEIHVSFVLFIKWGVYKNILEDKISFAHYKPNIRLTCTRCRYKSSNLCGKVSFYVEKNM